VVAQPWLQGSFSDHLNDRSFPTSRRWAGSV